MSASSTTATKQPTLEQWMMMIIAFNHVQESGSVDIGDDVSPVALADDDDDMLKKM